MRKQDEKMIHIATVHWKDDRWIDIQLKYLQKHVQTPFRVYAFLNDLPRDHSGKFFYSSTEMIKSHAVKLNILADIISSGAGNADDVIVFLDGDAFPIKPLDDYLQVKLAENRLIAVQRLENNGDIQPHPCFCASTVGFWKGIEGDWKKGYEWKTPQGEMTTDVGGNLLEILQKNDISWYPLQRSNRINERHPLFFGVYDDIIYHHGAGFRKGFSRSDRLFVQEDETKFESSFYGRCLNCLPDRGYWKKLRKHLDPMKKKRMQIKKKNDLMIEDVYRQIEQNEDFYTELL